MVSTRRCDNFWSLVLFSGFPRRGCGIQRTPGDKVIVEKRNKQYITGCAHVGGGCYLRGVCLLPCYAVYVTVQQLEYLVLVRSYQAQQ